MQEFYTCFINTNLGTGWRCCSCDGTIDDTVETDAFVSSKHCHNDWQAYGDSVMEFLIELFSVLNKTTDCISYPCQAHACAVTTRANIDISYCTDSLKDGFVAKQIAKQMVKTIIRRATSNNDKQS